MRLGTSTVGEVKPQLTLSANEHTPSTLLYTTADNVWRNNTAQAWGTHTAGDLVARGKVRRSLANTSNLLADASQASVAELKAQWWQNEIPSYLQWSVDVPSFPWLLPYLSYTSSGVSKSFKKTTIAGVCLTSRWSAEDARALRASEP